MNRYAFIDVQNTETTTLKLLGFSIDHKKLFLYLKNKWLCDKVFFYLGIQNGDMVRDNLFKEISDLGAIVRVKYYFVYKNKDRIIKISCPKCITDIVQNVNMGYTWKCNCDVDMTMDVIKYVNKDNELLLFTGDGDFEPLIEEAVSKEVKVYLVSSARKIKTGYRVSNSRFATKLRDLLDRYPKGVIYLDINDWKFRIKKD